MQPMIFSTTIISIIKKFPNLESLHLSLWLEPEWVMHNTQSYKFYYGLNQIAMEKNIEIEVVDLHNK